MKGFVVFGAVALLTGLWGCDQTTRVDKVVPAVGPVAGGQRVTIHGSGFHQGMRVHFGQERVAVVVVEGPGRIRVKTPAGVEGRVDVVVTDENGSVYLLKAGFRYQRAEN